MTPGDRPLECERLAETLRGLRVRTGLSLAALAAKTPYSKSSWDRYLRGTTVPPRQAVAELCELAAEDPGRALALWELADAVASGRGGRPTAVEPSSPPGEPHPPEGDGSPPGSRRPPRRALLAAVVGTGLTAAALLAGLSATGAFSDSSPSASRPRPPR